MPRVSVIVNVWNGAATLREALDSVLAQTFTDWELIVWDDCSTDGSGRIAADYRDPRVRYFVSPEPTPLGRVRDMAIRAATGEWVAFLDQDDVWLRDKLARQMALAGKGVGLLYGRTLMFLPSGTERDFDHRHEFKPLPEGDIFEQLFSDSCFISMSSSVLLRSAVLEAGGIPSWIQVIPDYYMFVAVARRYEARAVQGVICRYRRHASGMSAAAGVRIQAEALLVLDQWARCLPPELARRRRVVHSTVLAWEEMRRAATFARGIDRLLTSGSVPFLLSRPFARAYRAVRRHVRDPYWRMIATPGT